MQGTLVNEVRIQGQAARFPRLQVLLGGDDDGVHLLTFPQVSFNARLIFRCTSFYGVMQESDMREMTTSVMQTRTDSVIRLMTTSVTQTVSFDGPVTVRVPPSARPSTNGTRRSSQSRCSGCFTTAHGLACVLQFIICQV